MADSGLGPVAVTVDGGAVVAVTLGEPAAGPSPDPSFGPSTPDGAAGAALARRIAAYCDGAADDFDDLALSLAGTAFQRRVWQALRELAPGETCGYGELAARLGMDGGARAVAGACAANRLAVVVPCHRVVRADGGLGGYRWGIARKQALLALEAGAARQASAAPA